VVPDFLLPEWVPNAHPLIVHFPIALIFVAVAADTLALWLGERWKTGQEVATGLYLATGLSAIVSYYSGTWAIDTVTIATPDAAQTLSTHSFWAWYTMVTTSGYALVRAAGLFVAAIRGSRAAHVVLFVVGLGTLFPLYKTGENGGEMVYRQGVGVTRIQEVPVPASAKPDSTAQDTARAAESTPGSGAP
jgi:uncharacterized membrane protein